MELKIIEKKKNKLILEVAGGDVSVCNLIRKELWSDDKVKVSGYNIDHPLIGNPKLIVETTGARDPADAVGDSITRIKKQITKFSKSAAKAVK